MSIQLIHVSDIHFGSGEGHGRINPETGLNIRFEDFVSSLNKVIDFAINKNCDVFLFSGDAYRNASPEPVYQKMFAKALKRLSDAQIKTILLVGNHDQILRSTSSHSMSVFQSLEIPMVMTIDHPLSTVIETKNGKMQLIGLPHITKHQLLTDNDYLNLPAATIDKILKERIDTMLSGYYADLDPNLPCVVTAHMTVDSAVAGIEQELLIGYTLTFPSSIFMHKNIDYVALGHVHKHQIINKDNPAIVYAGSLDRVDFGEQDEDKGFIHVNLKKDGTTYQFHSINPRPFITIEVDLTNKDDITEYLCSSISKRIVPGCVLRVRYKIRQEQLQDLNESKVRAISSQALSMRLQPEVVVTANRARLPQLSEQAAASPLTALDLYLSETAPERKDKLMQQAMKLMSEDKT